MNKNLDLDKVWFVIRKSTPKRFDRMQVSRQRDGSYKLMITSEDSYCANTMEFLSCIMNHEFLHVILGEFVSSNYYGVSYDKLLQLIGRYSDDTMMEDWL